MRRHYPWPRLHVATANGHKEFGELLIAKGADVNATDVVLAYTPLNRIDVDSKDIAELLRKQRGKTKKEQEAAGN